MNDLDSAAITQAFRAFQDAWNSHDAAAFASLFADDAEFVNVVGMRAHGKDEIEAFHRPIFETMFSESRLTVTNLLVRFLRPDIAAVDIEWEMTGAKDPKGRPVPHRRGIASAVLAKDDGTWPITVFHNQDLPDFAPAAATENPFAGMTDPIAR